MTNAWFQGDSVAPYPDVVTKVWLWSPDRNQPIAGEYVPTKKGPVWTHNNQIMPRPMLWAHRRTDDAPPKVPKETL